MTAQALTRIALWLVLFVIPLPTHVRAQGAPPSALTAAREQAKAGRPEEAIASLRRSVALLPKKVELRRELARLLARDPATFAEAEQLYAGLVKEAPRNAYIAMERADNFGRAGEAVKAALEYRRAFEIAPDNEKALRLFVAQTARIGAVPVAIERYQKRLAERPQNPAERLLLAGLLHSEARYNEALDHYWIVQRNAPENHVARRAAAESWLALGYYDHAEKLFSQLARRGDGVAGQVLADRARVLRAAGRPEMALDILRQASPEEKAAPAILLELADTYRTVGQFDRESAVLQRLLTLRPHARDVLERVARASFLLGDRERTRHVCEELLKDDPQNAVAALGLKLLIEAVSPASVPAAQEAIEVVRDSRAIARDVEAGEAALFWERAALALAPLRRAFAARPDSPSLSLALATAFLQTNDASLAADALAGVVVGRGRRPDALLMLARVELLRRRPEHALQIYNEVLRLDSRNFRALTGQAEALQQAGDDEQAAALFAGLFRLAPESNTTKINLERSLSTLGRLCQSLKPGAVGEHQPMASDGVSPYEPALIPGDLLRLKVAGRLEPVVEAQVDAAGMLRFPSLREKFSAQCLTESELNTNLGRNPELRRAGTGVEIRVVKYRRARLSVSGAVYAPGSFNVRVPVDVRSSLMLADGAGPRAGSIVYVLRGASACRCRNLPDEAAVETYERAEFEVAEVKQGRQVRAGDTVIVPDREAVFITGAVARPAVLAAGGRVTLSQAVRLLGGTRGDAQRSRVNLLRSSPQGAPRQTFIVNLDEIEGGRVGDVILRPGDLVHIPSSGIQDPLRALASLLQLTGGKAEPLPLNEPAAKATTAKDQ